MQVLSESTIAANDALELLKNQLKEKWDDRQYTKSIVAIIDVM